MNIDLIIFDLDGTLVNSIPDLTISLNHVAKKINKPQFSEGEISSIVGGGITRLIEKSFNIPSNDLEFKNILNLFMKHHEQNCTNMSYLYKNTIEILEYFKSKKLAILSNKIDYLTKQVVSYYNIDSYFDIVLGATDELSKKPSPEPVLHILNTLNILPNNAIMVGDSEPDIICSKNAGIRSVALTSGYRSKAQLEPLKPDFLIDNIYDLKDIII